MTDYAIIWDITKIATKVNGRLMKKILTTDNIFYKSRVVPHDKFNAKILKHVFLHVLLWLSTPFKRGIEMTA